MYSARLLDTTVRPTFAMGSVNCARRGRTGVIDCQDEFNMFRDAYRGDWPSVLQTLTMCQGVRPGATLKEGVNLLYYAAVSGTADTLSVLLGLGVPATPRFLEACLVQGSVPSNRPRCLALLTMLRTWQGMEDAKYSPRVLERIVACASYLHAVEDFRDHAQWMQEAWPEVDLGDPALLALASSDTEVQACMQALATWSPLRRAWVSTVIKGCWVSQF